MACIQSKLTPCFRLSLAWSATSDTITKAAATQKQRKKEIYAQPRFNEDTLRDCELTTKARYMAAAAAFVSVCQDVSDTYTELHSAGLPCVSSYSLESGERLFR